MLLNADIVFDNLPAELHANLSGPKTLELSLSRPQLYEGHNKPFEAGRLYVVHADRLPGRAHAQRGSAILCIGDSPQLERYRQRCSIITVDERADFYQTFNIVQGIFDLYDSWEHDVNRIADESGDVSRLLTRSEELFGNPLYALDASFRILGLSSMATALDSNPAIKPADEGSLRLGAFDQFLELHDLSMDEREPLVISILDQTTLNFNLHEADTYRGCLTVHYVNRAYRPSDKPLIASLGNVLMKAMRQLGTHAPEGPGSLRQALQNLVEERPLDAIERDVVDSANNGHRFVCMRLKLSNQLEQLPLGYVRNTVEHAFSKCIVFDYHRNSIVAVIDIDELGDDDYRTLIGEGIEPFTGSMEMKAGLSGPYDDLVRTRAMFLQADAALDMGTLFDPAGKMYCFEDYALRELVMNAVGEMPLDLLIPEGLRKLVEHDATSETSYVETLRVYLDNNAGVARTAAQLYVHRSTLMERLARIKRDLDMDLEDPDEQLLVRIYLKAMQVRDELRSRKN